MFKFVKSLDGAKGLPYIAKAAAGTYHVGTALYLDNGVAKVATGAAFVQYIAQENKTLSAEDELIVLPVTGGMIFEAPISAFSASTQKTGLTVTIHTDGEKVTASAPGSGSAANGGAYIYDTLGAAAAGDKILVRLGYYH